MESEIVNVSLADLLMWMDNAYHHLSALTSLLLTDLALRCSISAELSQAFSRNIQIIHYNVNIAVVWAASAGFFVKKYSSDLF